MELGESLPQLTVSRPPTADRPVSNASRKSASRSSRRSEMENPSSARSRASSRGADSSNRFTFAYTPPETPSVTVLSQIEEVKVILSAEEIATKAMMEIDRYLKLRGAKLIDMLRSTSNEKTDNLHLTREEFAAVLQRTDVRISAQDIDTLFDYIDANGNGELDVKELADSIRDAKKRVRNTPKDAVSRVLSKDANYDELELKMLRRHLIPQLIRNRYYTRQQRNSHSKKSTTLPTARGSPTSPNQNQKLWGIWAWNQAYQMG